MSDTQLPSGSDFAAPALTEAPLSIRQAVTDLASARRTAPPPEEGAEPQDSPPAQAREARDERGRFARAEPADPDSGDEPEYAAPDEDRAPGDETEGDDPARDEPPIDPPRSWTKEDKEAFKALPRDIQERISERERAREVEFRKGQDQTAEQRRAAEAERQRADAERQHLEKVRQQYEATLPQLHNKLQALVNQAFPEIKTWDDVRKLAAEDPLRYSQWDAHQKELQAVAQMSQAAQQRQAQEQEQQRQALQKQMSDYIAEQTRLIQEKVPDLRDPEKADKVVRGARQYLSDIGFSNEELAAMWDSGKPILLHDARIQSIILDGLMYRQAKEQAKTAAKPNTPPVQRPGVAAPRKASAAADIEALNRKLDEGTGSIRDKLSAAAALVRAQRSQQARRA